MPRFARIALIATVVLVAVVSFLVIRAYDMAGQFTTLVPQFNGTCRAVAAPLGPEDIAIDRARELIFISAFDRRRMLAGDANAQGGIFLMRLDAPEEGAMPLTSGAGEAPADFRPHGISLYTGADGRQTLMAVNHPAAGGHGIEIFDVTTTEDGRTRLRHRASVADPLFTSPNDVAAVDHDRFYATNDHGATSTFMGLAETFLPLPWASVVYWDGQAMRVAADGLVYANGIAVSADGSTLYTAETTGHILRMFAREAGSGALRQRDQVFLGTGLDGIDFAPDGSLWIAAHPHQIDFLVHAGDATKLSPSQVIRVMPSPEGGGEARTIYLNLGQEISAASTAVAAGDTLVIANVFEPKLLICTMTR